MESVCKLEDLARKASPYVEELRGFFATRGVEFGSPGKIEPFVQRLDADREFRNQMSSMVRAIIYRARDGFAECELLDLVLLALGGTEAQATRRPVEELRAFVQGVFRSRWKTVPEEVQPVEDPPSGRVEQPAGTSATVETPTRPGAVPAEGAAVVRAARHEPSVFSRAHRLSDSQQEARPAAHARPEPDPEAQIPPEWRGAFLSGAVDSEPESRRWLWNFGFGALLLAFCGGLFFAQRAAVESFQQPPARPAMIAVKNQNHPDVSPVGPAAAPAAAPPAAPAPSNAATLSKPSAGVRFEGVSRAAPGSLGARTRPVDLAQTGRTSGVALGVSPAIMRSRLLYAPRTDYPAIARLAHVEGKVEIEAIVSRSGHVVHADVISGHRLLRGAALRSVRGRRYRPYVVDGKPASVATVLTVDFRLHR